MSMRALSDFLPSLSASARRELWVPESLLADVEAVTNSLRTAYDGEALLEASFTQTLIHIGPGTAARALNYVYGRHGAEAILFHPSADVRNTQRALYLGHSAIRVVDSLDELSLAQGRAVNVFMDENCFDLDLIEAIVVQAEIAWLIGAFESARYPTLSIYKKLQESVRHFRLRDITINSLLHGGPKDVLDVSIVASVSADTLDGFDEALAGEWVLGKHLQLISDAQRPPEQEALRHLAARYPGTMVVESSNGIAEAFRVAFGLAQGRYLAVVPSGLLPNKRGIEKLFTSAIAANADMVLATSDPVPADEQVLLGVQRLGFEDLPHAIAKTSAALFRTDFLNFYDLAFNPSGGEAALPALAGLAAISGAQSAGLHMPAPLASLNPEEHHWLTQQVTARVERMGRKADRELASALLTSVLAQRRSLEQNLTVDFAASGAARNT